MKRLWQHRIRLYSGLILFVFAGWHLLNHSLGLVSLEAMEAMRDSRVTLWRSLPGTILLYGALLVHIVFALAKFIQRRTWRMTRLEGTQLAFGLTIPALLLPHVLGTRMPYERFGIDDNYLYTLTLIWPDYATWQAILVVLVWVHGCIGLHFWLRLKPWYSGIVWPLNTITVLLPVLAYAGFTVASRQVQADGSYKIPLSADQFDIITNAWDVALWGSIGVVCSALIYRVARSLADRRRPTVTISYADGQSVKSEIGPTLLEISRNNGIAHASVCGGRARCSTCRVRVLDGLADLPEADEEERKVLKRVGAGDNVRLACQLRPTTPLTVATLLPAQRISNSDLTAQDKYLWGVDQTVTIMFSDIRGFTSLSEAKLPYDVVFLLNQYLGQMSDAISDAGGYVDKFIGDGIMAIFGMDDSHEKGALNALAAAQAMEGVLLTLNESLKTDLDQPLNIGIGIHTGPAILGRIGVVGASGASQRITALGDTVNTASRLESACKTLKCQLTVSKTTMDACQRPISGGRSELISVKGREQHVPVHAYERATDMEIANSKTASPDVEI